jgi:hypothetical protein
MLSIPNRLAWCVGLATLAACSIATHVQPVPPNTLSSLCIQENDQTWSKEFLPTLQAQLQRRGIASTVY